MTVRNSEYLNSLLADPEIARIISEENFEVDERRMFSPGKIAAFSGGPTRLVEKPEYRFMVHGEAKRQLPDIISNNVQLIAKDSDISREVEKEFTRQRNIGVVFSGGPAPGGHNVIAGLYDAALAANPKSRLYGFLMGPDGLIECNYIEITKDLVDTHRNMGGFSMIMTGRTKIDSDEKMARSLAACRKLQIDALVIIGGDDSNTNAAFLAQHFKSHGINVIGVPKTIDGDIQVKTLDNEVLCAVSFGFHSAARAFSENISNLCADASSTKKYWHVCKVMGRVASHLTLETALQTHVNLALIGEELADYEDKERMEKARQEGTIDYTAYGITLRHLSRLICRTIVQRAAVGKNYGVIVIPEGILEFINEIQIFIIKLNTIIADYNRIHDLDFHKSFPGLSEKLLYLRHISQGLVDKSPFPIWNQRDDELFTQLPTFFQEGLLQERDKHGNFQFSQVKTEVVIMNMVKEYLNALADQGVYKIGIENQYYHNLMLSTGLDGDKVAKAIFKNPDEPYLLVSPEIISLKTLKQVLENHEILGDDEAIPPEIQLIFSKSQPDFNTQTHFYGYDGRGTDPSYFDCIYTYNLGLTAFHLIAGNATGQMAAIKNLEKSFDQWEPMGIPIAKLMHLEERKGKLALVMEKAIVDLDSKAFHVFKAIRENWIASHPGEDDYYRRTGPVRFSDDRKEDRPLTLVLNGKSNT